MVKVYENDFSFMNIAVFFYSSKINPENLEVFSTRYFDFWFYVAPFGIFSKKNITF